MSNNTNPILPPNFCEDALLGDASQTAVGDEQMDMETFDDGDEQDQFRSDAEADADALASCGFGTDEDYGGDCEHI